MGLKPPNAAFAQRTEKGSPVRAILFALLFVGWVGEWPLDLDQLMYSGMWRSPFVVFGPLFEPVPGLHLFPWQILLFLILPFCLGAPGTARQHAREMDRAIYISMGCIAVTFLWGCLRGGSPYFAYYQIWRFLASLLIGYMLMSLLRTERDFVSLAKVVIVAALIRATLCIYFYWAYLAGKPLPFGYVTNHDDSMLWVLAILIISVWAFLKGGRKPWTAAAFLVPYLLYAVALNNRRLAWVELGLAAPLVYIMIGAGPLRSRINRWVMWVAPIALIYVAVGMGSDSPIFAPVHALTTTGSNLDTSSLTRKEEVRNLLRTLVNVGNPIFGTGWGVPYQKTESIWSNYDPKWILYLYTPHNSIVGLAAFTGLVGIIGMWGVIPMGAYLAARGYLGSSSPVTKTAAMVALCSFAAYSAHCYGDIGLQSFGCALIFGAALGAAGKVATWADAAQPAVQSAGKAAQPASPGARSGRVPQRPRSPTGRGPTVKPNPAPRRLPR
jgi:O-Antigen ligase